MRASIGSLKLVCFFCLGALVIAPGFTQQPPIGKAQPAQPAQPVLPAAAGLPEGHWEKLVERWKAGEAWLPRRMAIRSRDFGNKGDVVSREENEFVLSYPRGPLDPDSRLVRSIKDGKDITAERAGKPQGRRPADSEKGSDLFPQANPFYPSIQDRLSWEGTRKGTSGVEIDYTIAYEKRKVRGTLLMDMAGEPRSYSYRYDPLPSFVSVFDGSGSFSILADGSIGLGGISMLAEGSLLLVRKKYHFQMEFLDPARE